MVEALHTQVREKKRIGFRFEVGMLKNPIEIHCNPKE